MMDNVDTRIVVLLKSTVKMSAANDEIQWDRRSDTAYYESFVLVIVKIGEDAKYCTYHVST